jgi:hypothetical protein
MCRFISRPHIDLAASQPLLHNINMSVDGSLSPHKAEAKIFEDLRLQVRVTIRPPSSPHRGQ